MSDVSETFRPDLFARRTAVVTGGTSGLGAATARVLARLGAEVHAVGLGSDATAFTEPGIHVAELDVTDDAALAGFFGGLERLDILVPAAGISMGARELEWEAFQRVVSIQLLAVYRTIDLARPLLARTRGSVITIASMYAYFGGGTIAAYSAAKGGVVQLTTSLAEVYAVDGIRVNSIAPGWIETPLLAPLKADPVIGERPVVSHAAETLRRPRGGRHRGGVPRLGRRLVRDRCRPAGRRRLPRDRNLIIPAQNGRT